MNRFTIACAFYFAALGVTTSAFAFEKVAHRSLTERAITLQPRLDGFLKDVIGMPDGVTTSLLGRRIERIVADGAEAEDALYLPAFHFHDPTRPLEQAGLRGYLGIYFQSSVAWSQDEQNDSSWRHARETYYQALTSDSEVVREFAFSRTFSSLGHLRRLAWIDRDHLREMKLEARRIRQQRAHRVEHDRMHDELAARWRSGDETAGPPRFSARKVVRSERRRIDPRRHLVVNPIEDCRRHEPIDDGDPALGERRGNLGRGRRRRKVRNAHRCSPYHSTASLPDFSTHSG